MIYISYGSNVVQNTYDTLAASDIDQYLMPHMQVSLKPNLVVPCPASDGATTHPEVVEGVVRFLRDYGIRHIKIIESSWVGDCTKRAFEYCGYHELSQKFDIPLIDLKSDSFAYHHYDIIM